MVSQLLETQNDNNETIFENYLTEAIFLFDKNIILCNVPQLKFSNQLVEKPIHLNILINKLVSTKSIEFIIYPNIRFNDSAL